MLCTNRLVRCGMKRLVPTDARRPSGIGGITHVRRGRGILLYRSIDAKLDADHHEILEAPSSDEIDGRNVYRVSCSDVATGGMGEARGTTMARVKRAIATDVSSAL